MSWTIRHRPGYFGRQRNKILASYNAKYGVDGWKLAWIATGHEPLEFEDACKAFYEHSYSIWFAEHQEELDVVCSYGECIDNAPTNVHSGCGYTKQEAFSTHIQDIAVRNIVRLFGRKFEGDKDNILVIRSADSTGYKYGPGNIPFYDRRLIT